MRNFIHQLMDGWEISMKNKKIRNILVLAMTVGILGAIGYLSFVLNGGGKNSPTQIKKTKASAITYTTTVLLAMNTEPIPSQIPPEESSESNNASEEVAIPTEISTPSPTTALLSYNSSSSSTAPEVVPTTIIPTPTSTLIVYRNPSPTIFNLPVRNTGVATTAPTKAVPTKEPTVVLQTTDTLPETGWFQFTSIFFIVGVTTLFISFLF